MPHRLLTILVLSVFCGLSAPEVWARGQLPPTGEEPARAKARAKPVDGPVVKAKEQLANTAWDVTLNPMSGDPKKSLTDQVQFVNDQVSSKRLMSQGFPSSHFTVSVGADGMVTWETMQTSDKHGVAFWRGELEGTEIMRGVFSHRPPEGDPRDYSFVGKPMAAVPAPAAPAAQEPPATPPVAATPVENEVIVPVPSAPAAATVPSEPVATPPVEPPQKTRHQFKLW